MCCMEAHSAGNVLIAAGGTGGHIFPAQTLAHCLLGKGFQPTLVTDRRGIELGCGRAGLPCYTLYSSPFSNQGLMGVALAGMKLSVGVVQAWFLVRRLEPVAVVGFGGHASLPLMLVAVRMKLPTVIHEANAVLGRANRLLAPRVSAIATSFDNTAGLARVHRGKEVRTGMPVRTDIVSLRGKVTRSLSLDSKIQLLVIGGSQGSRVLSEVVPAALAQMPSYLKTRVVVVHQCRAIDQDKVATAFEIGGINASVSPFIEDMAAALGDAHLVISRSGASTVAELAAAGRPALLVPFPHATDDHQTANARALVDAGGAWMMHENDFKVPKLKTWLVDILRDPRVLAAVGHKARTIGEPDAASNLAEVTSRLISKHGIGLTLG